MVSEASFQPCPAPKSVQAGNDGDGKEWGQPRGHGRVEQDAEDDADDQSADGNQLKGLLSYSVQLALR